MNTPTHTPDFDTLDAGLRAKHTALLDLLRGLERAVVAFSGGVDSTLLLRVAVEALGERAVGLCAVSESFAPWELVEARALAEGMGARLIEVRTNELRRDAYRANAGDRCYHCKTELFEIAAAHAQSEALGVLTYGAIPDDLGDHRPGMTAASERGVRAPLIEANLSKLEIRALSRAYGLPTAEKPAAACMSSRFPDGTPITAERLAQVTACEGALRDLALRHVRARFHGDLVRVELGPDELARALTDATLREGIVRAGRGAGFRYVTLDLQGYRAAGAQTLVQLDVPRRG